MPGGDYVLFQDYQTMPEQLILARILNRCAHVFDELSDIRRRAAAEHWPPFMVGFAECCISRKVICSLDLAGLTGRRHQNVVRAIERRAERKRGRSAIYPTKSRYVAPTGLRSGMSTGLQGPVGWSSCGGGIPRMQCHLSGPLPLLFRL